MIAVEAINFNYDGARSDRDALNIRRNATMLVTVPEWRRYQSATPRDSLAVYTIKAVRGRPLLIQVMFSSADKALQTVEIQVPDMVKSRIVTFIHGTTGFVQFEVINNSFVRQHVGIWDVTWRWQYRTKPGRRWRRLQTTRHRIYVILDKPTSPWKQRPNNATNTQLLWTDILEFACRWAAGAATKREAAALITECVYDLGSHLLTYDCPGGGSSHYSSDRFDATAFLERLYGGLGNGVYVNCSDCAAIVSTFANALGCNLR
jgi:hypothetical protein